MVRRVSDDMALDALPVTQQPRDRLRHQIKLERVMTDRVLAAQRRLAAEKSNRASTIAACDAKVRARADDLADAMIAYLDRAGVRPERAAVVLGLPTSLVTGIIRERRATLRRNEANPKGRTCLTDS
jgi:hypothetical protein